MSIKDSSCPGAFRIHSFLAGDRIPSISNGLNFIFLRAFIYRSNHEPTPPKFILRNTYTTFFVEKALPHQKAIVGYRYFSIGSIDALSVVIPTHHAADQAG